jgi:hypothetical protein
VLSELGGQILEPRFRQSFRDSRVDSMIVDEATAIRQRALCWLALGHPGGLLLRCQGQGREQPRWLMPGRGRTTLSGGRGGGGVCRLGAQVGQRAGTLEFADACHGELVRNAGGYCMRPTRPFEGRCATARGAAKYNAENPFRYIWRMYIMRRAHYFRQSACLFRYANVAGHVP